MDGFTTPWPPVGVPRLDGMVNIDYRTLGPSGLVVSTVGLGCNNFGRAGTATETQEGTDAVIGL